ncbi:hypothetical protein ACP4OV_021209 [Aristida adscensionis]
MFQNQAKTCSNKGTYSTSCFSKSFSRCFSCAAAEMLSGMTDHFTVMAGRLLTESTLQSAIDEASAVPSSIMTSCDVVVQDGGPKTGVLVECRICQEDDDEAYMETPCSCKGSLKHAHRKCIQRWCDEKGDTICEICLKQFKPNYTATSRFFRHGRNSIFFSNPTMTADQTSVASTSYERDHSSTSTSIIYCRLIAITLLFLLVLHDAFSAYLGDQDAYTVAMVTLLMLRTAGIVIPVYIILVSVSELLRQRSQQQVVHDQVSEHEGAQSTQALPLPTRQLTISIQ